MYEQHPIFTPELPDDAQLWRYVDFTKFVAMLSKRALFFCRMDRQAGDTWEGTLPRSQYDAMVSAAEAGRRRQLDFLDRIAAQAAAKDGEPATGLAGYRDYIAKADLLWFNRLQRSWAAVNCWHENEHESMAMWSVYLQSPLGLAVRTSGAGLKRCFEGWNEPVMIGRIRPTRSGSMKSGRARRLFPPDGRSS